MLRITKKLPSRHGVASVLLQRAARVVLPFEDRQKSRLPLQLSDGREAGLFLDRGSVLRGGDVLVAEDGSFVLVEAAPEPVLVVRAPDARALTRAAYHLGNRHVQLEVGPDHLKLEPDHVLRAMLEGLGLTVETAELPFEPESGAYGAEHQGAGHEHAHEHHHGHSHEAEHQHGPGCGHDHGHKDTHKHDHDHDHKHDHEHGEHQHGPGCGHHHG